MTSFSRYEIVKFTDNNGGTWRRKMKPIFSTGIIFLIFSGNIVLVKKSNNLSGKDRRRIEMAGVD